MTPNKGDAGQHLGVLSPSTLVLSRYVQVTASVLPGIHLLFVPTSGALLEITEEQSRSLCPGEPLEGIAEPLLDRLKEVGALVTKGNSEIDGILARRRQAKAAPGVLNVTIAPTMQCNFRCTYCFEEHRQEFMAPDVQAALIQFLRSRGVASGGINITWFGGEPLLAVGTIEAVHRSLEKLDVLTHKDLITNGYLLTQATIDRLLALGDWGMVQITIDGTPIVHDGRRMLVSGAGTWTRVVRNIKLAVTSGLPVSVRVNIDKTNSAHIERLVHDLVDVGVLPGAQIYLGSVTDYTQECSHTADVMLSRHQFASKKMQLRRVLLELGFSSGTALPQPICSICTADDANGYVIAPTGRIFKCWNEVHLPVERAIGHLTGLEKHPDFDQNRANWAAYDPLAHRGCLECHALPVCLGGCPWVSRALSGEFGDCGDYRFYPNEIIQIAHAEKLIDAGVQEIE